MIKAMMSKQVFEETGVNYISNDFNMYYAPDQVRSILRVWPLVTSPRTCQLLKDILEDAKECVKGWTIRDEVDKRDQEFVLTAELSQ